MLEMVANKKHFTQIELKVHTENKIQRAHLYFDMFVFFPLTTLFQNEKKKLLR